MPKPGCFCVVFFSVMLLSFNAYCQPANNDSAFYNNAVNNVKTTYFSAVKEKAGLYNGTAYEAYGHGVNGIPFFLADSMVMGSVMYDGFLYEDVPVKYDMDNDQLLTTYYYNNTLLQLIKDEVGYFDIMGHRFVRFDKNQQTPGSPDGFCELLYGNKKMSVLVKRGKRIQQSTNPDDKSSTFVQYNQYLIYRDNKFLPVNSEDDLMKIFNDKAPDLKKFMRSKKVKYKKNAEQAILTATLFYNGITN